VNRAEKINRRSSWLWLCCWALCLAAVCSACKRDEARAATPAPVASKEAADKRKAPRSSVVIFLIDTVRADHVSAYGYRRKTTPVFDRFASENLFFPFAYSPTPWTRPSVVSLFTGQNAQLHDVQKRQDRLPDEATTLAEVLRDRGYYTAMVNTNPHVTEAFGLTQGFARVEEIMPDPKELKTDGNRASVVAQRVAEVAPSLREPFLLYVHIVDPHYPYDPPRADLEAIGVKANKPNSETRYDGELHFADHWVGEMMKSLEAAGKLERAITIITADHGDEFRDHGNIGHGKTLYQEVVKVPLAMRLPQQLRARLFGGEGAYPNQRITPNVSLIDLMPTLVELCGAEQPAGMEGRSLLPLLKGEVRPGGELRPLFMSVDKERGSYAGVLVGQTKLIVSRSSGKRQLFFLDRDPKEKNPSPSGSTEWRDNLEQLLRSYEASIEPGVHLDLACKDDEKNSQHMQVTLETSGRFVDVSAHGFEAGDRFELRAEGKQLFIDAHQVAVLHESPKTMHVQDRDELVFEVEPGDAEISLTVQRDGARPGLSVLRAPRIRSGGWPVKLTRLELAKRTGNALVDLRKSGVYLYVRQAPTKALAGPLSEDVTSALKSLGYLQ